MSPLVAQLSPAVVKVVAVREQSSSSVRMMTPSSASLRRKPGLVAAIAASWLARSGISMAGPLVPTSAAHAKVDAMLGSVRSSHGRVMPHA